MSRVTTHGLGNSILGVLEYTIRFLRVHLYSSISKASINDSETHDNFLLKSDISSNEILDKIEKYWSILKSTFFSRLTPIMTRLRKSYFIRQMDICNLLESC